MSTAVLAILSSICFAGSVVSVYRGSLRADVSLGLLISIFFGVPFFAVLALAFGQLRVLSVEAWFLFGVAGVVHFLLGRAFNYAAIREIGASRSGVVSAASPLVSVALAVSLLGEHIGLLLAVGGGLAISGPIILAWQQRGGTIADAATLRR
ncbi:MAG: EamA family transporter, partial [Dehalococcoidia bacterium]|nr:EamA family transporter [Dehalococcoidia bacterium]